MSEKQRADCCYQAMSTINYCNGYSVGPYSTPHCPSNCNCHSFSCGSSASPYFDPEFNQWGYVSMPQYCCSCSPSSDAMVHYQNCCGYGGGFGPGHMGGAFNRMTAGTGRFKRGGKVRRRK